VGGGSNRLAPITTICEITRFSKQSNKGLVEDDVGRAFGHGIEAKRSKSGAITIREKAA